MGPGRCHVSAAPPARWVSVQSAADVLGLTASALRKTPDRLRLAGALTVGSRRRSTVSRCARKFGRLWRVTLSAALGLQALAT